VKRRIPAEQRKLEIEEVALRLAFEQGPAHVTTGMIAAELGLTQPAIYKHFPCKSDIWTEISKRLSHRITQNISHALKTECAPNICIRKLIIGHLELIEECPALPEFMIMRETKDGHIILQNSIQTAMTSFRNALMQNVQAAAKDDIFIRTIDPEDATTLIFGVIQSLVLRMMVTRNPAILTADGARLLDLQLAGFLTKGKE